MFKQNLFLRYFFWSLFLLSLILLKIQANETEDTYKNKRSYLEEVEKKRRFTFNIDRDKNNFPDTWFIKKGKGYQQYHSILIDNTNGSDDNKSLRILFSGGKTSVYTSPLKLNQRYAYNLSLNIKSLNLKKSFNHKFVFGLKALNKKQEVIETFENTITDFSKYKNSWQKCPLLRISKLPSETHSCIIFIELSGRDSGRSILWLDNVHIDSSPRIIFSTNEPLNIFPYNKKLDYKAKIEGLVKDKKYTYKLDVKDFRGNEIDRKEKPFIGTLEPYTINKFIDKPIGETGVYYINIKLFSDEKELAKVEEIVARKINSTTLANFEFGVLIGRPQKPFSRLTLALKTLGAPLGKLELMPDNFSFENWNKNNQSFPKLDPLLREEAPNENFRFIGVIDKIPTESDSHESFKVNKAKHVSETFPTHSKEWKLTLKNILFEYGNVLRDWQIGKDETTLSDNQLQSASIISKHLTEKADWMKVFVPLKINQAYTKSITPNLFVPNSMSLDSLAKMLTSNGNQIPVTIQLDSESNTKRPTIIANLIKKITIAKAATNKNNQAIAKPIFIDSLTHEDAGLMTRNYQPHSTFFATKTIVELMQNAKYIGSFFFKEKDISNYVFKKDNLAFTIIWNKNKKSTKQFYLGSHVSLMDLMGNKQNLNLASDHSITVNLDQIPIILSTTIPKLWETMLSFELVNKNLSASVKLQNQQFNIKNHFNYNAKFDIELNYPRDWIFEKNIYSGEIDTKRTQNHPYTLSPSALSPVGKGIGVTAKLQISLPDAHHYVRIYREDKLSSGIQPNVKFYKTENGLQIDIHLETTKSIPNPTSFIATALMPGGEVIEVLFKDILPLKKSIQEGLVPNGLKYIGDEVQLSIREHNGNRHLLKNFPIKLAF